MVAYGSSTVLVLISSYKIFLENVSVRRYSRFMILTNTILQAYLLLNLLHQMMVPQLHLVMTILRSCPDGNRFKYKGLKTNILSSTLCVFYHLVEVSSMI